MKFSIISVCLSTSILLLVGCSKIQSLERDKSFGDYSLKDAMSFDRQNEEILFFDGNDKAKAFMDSLLLNESQDSWNFKRFVLIHNLYNQYDSNDDESFKRNTLSQFLDLLAHPNFEKEHNLNKALSNYYTCKVLLDARDYKLAHLYLEKAIETLDKEGEEDYDKILCLFYSQFSNKAFWNWESNEKSKEELDHAINICEGSNSYFDLDFLYRKKIVINKREGNKLDALTYYDDLERVVRSAKNFSQDNLWRHCYLNKIALFFELDEMHPLGGYQDSITFYFDQLHTQYENKEISDFVYRNIIKFNLNSLIKVGQTELAQSYIDNLDEIYQNETEINCSDIAFLNMNKYVMERTIGDRSSYREALINAFDHLESCVQDEPFDYDINMRVNVLFYLMHLDRAKGDYKNALKWSQLRYEDLKSQKNNSDVDSKISQTEFWANRERKYAQQAILIENEKTQTAVQKLYIIASAIIGLPLSFLAFFQYLKIRKQKLKNAKDHDLLSDMNQRMSDLNGTLEKSKEELFLQKRENEAELKNKMLYLMQRNNGADQLITEIKALNLERKIEKKLLEFANPMEQKLYWQDIEDQYLNQNKDFINYLQEKYPKLTSSNFKLLILVKLGMSNKEIAALKFVSPSSVKVALSRLRKKLQIDSGETNLYTFLNTLKPYHTEA